MEEFVSWCKARGYKFDGLEIVKPPGNCGHGVFTKKSFRNEEVMISVPELDIINAGLVADLPRYRKLLAGKDLLTPMELLTLFFCTEEEADSAWGPYLKVLPKSFDTPAFQGHDYDPATLPLSIRSYWVNQKKEIADITTKLTTLFPNLTPQRILWAWHVVNTRCIFVENAENEAVDQTDGDTIAVIPFVDMLNHSPSAAQGFALHDKINERYVVKAKLGAAEGSELYVCYGPHDNARLHIEYGFRVENNPNGKVVVPNDMLFHLAKMAGFKVTKEHERVVEEIGVVSHLYASDEGPSWALRNNIRVFLLEHWQMTRGRWKKIIYSQEPIEDEVDEEIDRRLKIMLTELCNCVKAKAQKMPDDVAWMWAEQVLICEVALTYFD